MPILDAAADSVSDLLRRANEALDGTREDGFDEFARAVRTLTGLEDQVQCLTALRPIRALREPLLDVAVSLGLTATSVLEALDAGTIQEAQRHAKTVQPAIDAATEALARAMAVFEAWRLLEVDTGQLEAMMRLAAEQAASTDLLDLAAFGSSQIATRMPGASLPAEYGLLGAVLSTQARTLFDGAQFWNLAVRVYAHLQSSAKGLSRLTTTSSWSTNWSRSVAQVLWAAERFAMLISHASHDEEAVRTVLSLCHEVQEGLTKTVLATLRFVSNPNTQYDVLLANGVANLAEWAVANGLPEFGALSIPTRNAFAHNDWRIDSGDVVLCELRPPAGGSARVTADELHDHALAIEEATLATYLGIVVAVVAYGGELPTDARLVSTVAGPIATAVLAAYGWTDLTIEWSSEDTVLMSGARDVGSVLQFASLGYLFPCASRLAVLARTQSGERSVSLDLHALRVWSNEQPDALKLLSFAEFLNKSTVDSRPIASKSQLRRTVAAVTSKWITERDDHRGVVVVFKKGRQVAEACGDTDLLAALKTAQGWRYSTLQGFHRPVSEIQEFLNWGQQVANIDPEF